MAALTFDWIREQVGLGNYYWSHHADQERQADDLTIKQVEQAIERGRIIERYPDSGRGESCLIAGFCDEGVPIHIVCGMRAERPVIVTTYVPTPPKFKNPYQRG